MIAVWRRRTLPAVTRAEAWLADRSTRERALLLVLAGVATAVIGWYGVTRPLLTARETALARIALYEGLQSRLRVAGPSAPGPASPAPVQGSLNALVQQAAAAQGLSLQIAGDDQRVTAEGAGLRFDAAATFLRDLEAAGATVDAARLDAAGQPGAINLSVAVRR